MFPTSSVACSAGDSNNNYQHNESDHHHENEETALPPSAAKEASFLSSRSSRSSRSRDAVTQRHHKHLARMLERPWIQIEAFLWKEVGGMYPYLDIPSGFCFLLGSLAFTVSPLLRMTMALDDAVSYALDWVNMVGVILFTVAKFLVELRAVYAHLFKGPAAQVSGWYHAAVIGFFVGGFLFGAYIILVLSEVDSNLTRARVSLSSSVFFIFGSGAFVVDAYPQAHKDKFESAPSNSYLLGSLLFLFGSACWIVGSSLLFPTVATSTSDAVENAFNFLGGSMFLLGSVSFLLLGYFEMNQFNRGPDMDLPAVRRRCMKLGIDPNPSSNPHFPTNPIKPPPAFRV